MKEEEKEGRSKGERRQKRGKENGEWSSTPPVSTGDP